MSLGNLVEVLSVPPLSSGLAQVVSKIALGVVLGIMVASAPVHAGPYEIVAVYAAPTAEQPDRQIEVKLTNRAVLPDRSKGLDLDRIEIRFERAGLGSITPGTFRNFAISTGFRGTTLAVSIPSSELKPSASRTLVKWRDVHGPQRLTSFDVSIHGKFSSEFLCSQELYLREMAGRLHACTGAKPDAGCAKDGFFDKPFSRPDRALFVDGSELLFTFCRAADPDEGGSVKWDLVHKDGNFGRAESAAQLRELHKRRMQQLLMQKEVLTKFVNPYAELRSGPDASGLPDNLFVDESFQFSVREVGELFLLTESDDTAPRSVSEVVAQHSTLIVSAAGAGVGDCPKLADFKYVFEVVGGDGKATIDELGVKYRDACRSALDVELTRYLDKRVTLRILQKVDASQELALVETQFTVASLGFQWTAPIISEVLTALTATSPTDLTASSSLPLGIALGSGGRTRLALTFPFRASWNTRSFTNLSRYFALFGHLSVLADPDGEVKPQLAVGAGVAVFQFFHFGWAMSLAEDHRNYFLLSVDIKDISKFILAERAD